MTAEQKKDIIDLLTKRIRDCEDDPDECFIDVGVGLTKNEAIKIFDIISACLNEGRIIIKPIEDGWESYLDIPVVKLNIKP